MKYLIESVGCIAAAMMLSAFVLLTTGRLNSNSPLYQWLNVLSGAGFIINSGWNGAYPSGSLTSRGWPLAYTVSFAERVDFRHLPRIRSNRGLSRAGRLWSLSDRESARLPRS